MCSTGANHLGPRRAAPTVVLGWLVAQHSRAATEFVVTSSEPERHHKQHFHSCLWCTLAGPVGCIKLGPSLWLARRPGGRCKSRRLAGDTAADLAPSGWPGQMCADLHWRQLRASQIARQPASLPAGLSRLAAAITAQRGASSWQDGSHMVARLALVSVEQSICRRQRLDSKGDNKTDCARWR